MSQALFAVAVALVAACQSPSYELHARAPAVSARSYAIGVVRIPAPWYAPRFLIARRFREAVPVYEALPDLIAKVFTISDDRRFGGIYLWRDRGAATAYYSAAWRADIRERRGHEPDVQIFDAPFLVRGASVLHGDPIDARGLSYPATATLSLMPGEDPAALAARMAKRDGLVDGAVVVAEGTLGFVGLWASREQAEAAVGARATYFDAPVIIR